jgi:hypothetical protein
MTSVLGPPPPIVGADLWAAVMDAASQDAESPRCQCAGACGQPHVKGGGRCPRTHGQHVTGHGPIRLAAGPADMTVTDTAAAALPATALMAWCPSCYDGARREARKRVDETARTTLTTMEGLF